MNLQIETTDKCQCKCTFCIKSVMPPKNTGDIDNNLYKEIIRQAKEFNISVLSLTGLGEPLLDPEFEDRVKIARKAFPKTTITMYTNGILATEEKIKSLVKAGLNEIYFSINAGSPEAHEYVMNVKGMFDQVVNVVKASINIPGLRVYIPVVIGSQWLENVERDKVLNQWPQKNLYLHYAGNWAGKLYGLHYTPQHSECRWFQFDAYINRHGDVCRCCYDPFGDHKYGNVRQHDFYHIWWGKNRHDFLRKIKEKGRGHVRPCKNCSTI